MPQLFIMKNFTKCGYYWDNGTGHGGGKKGARKAMLTCP